MLVRNGGNFVVKLFDVFTTFSVGLVYIMYKCFEKGKGWLIYLTILLINYETSALTAETTKGMDVCFMHVRILELCVF